MVTPVTAEGRQGSGGRLSLCMWPWSLSAVPTLVPRTSHRVRAEEMSGTPRHVSLHPLAKLENDSLAHILTAKGCAADQDPGLGMMELHRDFSPSVFGFKTFFFRVVSGSPHS